MTNNETFTGFKTLDKTSHRDYVRRRRTTLRRIILEKQYETVGAITTAMAHAGYAASIAVISNDLKVIGAIKIPNENGTETWTPVSGTAIPTFTNEDAITNEAMRAIRTGAQTITVYDNEVWIRATLGTNRSIQTWVSSLDWPEIGAVIEGLTDTIIKSWTHETAKYIRGKLIGVPEGKPANNNYIHASTIDIAGITEWEKEWKQYAIHQNILAMRRREKPPYPEFMKEVNHYLNAKAEELTREGLTVQTPTKKDTTHDY